MASLRSPVAPYRTVDLLGDVRAEYQAPARGRAGFLGATLSAGAVCAVSVGYLPGLLHRGTRVAALVAVLVALVTAVVAVLGARLFWQARGPMLRLGERGLELRTREGTRVIGWDEVREFRRHGPVARARGVERVLCSLTLATGARFVFTGAFGEGEELAARLEVLVGRHLACRMQARFDAGGSIAFGHLVVRPDGLFNGTEIVPWSAIQGVAVLDGAVHVVEAGRSKPPWLVVPLYETPNARAFAELIEHACAKHKREQRALRGSLPEAWDDERETLNAALLARQ